ncbi:MAG: deaminase, partial [Desulfomicrobiaceae bacterium]
MAEALKEAQEAERLGEVPVGAVVVREGKILAHAGNRVITQHDPTAHAEILALRQAAAREGNFRLPG